MSSQKNRDMKEACHVLAEYIMRQPTSGNRGDWLKKEIVATILGEHNIEGLAFDYSSAYPYADIQSSYLADTLKAYDNKEDVL